jgi:hypothetical protein
MILLYDMSKLVRSVFIIPHSDNHIFYRVLFTSICIFVADVLHRMTKLKYHQKEFYSGPQFHSAARPLSHDQRFFYKTKKSSIKVTWSKRIVIDFFMLPNLT